MYNIYNINEVFLGQIPDRIRARVPFDLQTFRFPALRFLWVYYSNIVLLRHTKIDSI